MVTIHSKLCDYLKTPSLANIVISYVRRSEAECVFDILMSSNSPIWFDIGWTNHVREYRCELCGIIKNPATKDLADEYGIPDWTTEARYKFSIGFGNDYVMYGTVIPVVLNDLLPTRCLNIPNIPDYEKRILDNCRHMYIARMSNEIRKIWSEEDI